jgi:hypothetical protein
VITSICSFWLIDSTFYNQRKIVTIHSSFSWILSTRQMTSDLRWWILFSSYSRDTFWRFWALSRTFCIKCILENNVLFQYDFMIVETMRDKNIECFFIKDIQEFMIFDWKNVLDHDIWFIMFLEMFLYVFQNDEKQIYVLSLIHHIERWCFYHRDVHHEKWFLFFRVKDFELIKIEFEIFNRFRIFNFIDQFCQFFVFSKKINRWLISWLIRTNFFSTKNFSDDLFRFSRVLDRVIEFRVIWLI